MKEGPRKKHIPPQKVQNRVPHSKPEFLCQGFRAVRGLWRTQVGETAEWVQDRNREMSKHTRVHCQAQLSPAISVPLGSLCAGKTSKDPEKGQGEGTSMDNMHGFLEHTQRKAHRAAPACAQQSSVRMCPRAPGCTELYSLASRTKG